MTPAFARASPLFLLLRPSLRWCWWAMLTEMSLASPVSRFEQRRAVLLIQRNLTPCAGQDINPLLTPGKTERSYDPDSTTPAIKRSRIGAW